MERRVIPGYEVGSPIGFGAGGTALAVRDAEGTSFARKLEDMKNEF